MFGSLLSVLAGATFRPTFTFGAAKGRSNGKRTNYYTPNGKREVARRLRQIQNGQLKVSK